MALTEVPDVPMMDLRTALGDHLEYVRPSSHLTCGGGLGGVLWVHRSTRFRVRHLTKKGRPCRDPTTRLGY